MINLSEDSTIYIYEIIDTDNMIVFSNDELGIENNEINYSQYSYIEPKNPLERVLSIFFSPLQHRVFNHNVSDEIKNDYSMMIRLLSVVRSMVNYFVYVIVYIFLNIFLSANNVVDGVFNFLHKEISTQYMKTSPPFAF